jgi:hypothetical protein
VPIRAKVIASLETLKTREGILVPAAGGGRIDINNWRESTLGDRRRRDRPPPRERRNRTGARFLIHGRGGFRTCDLSRVKAAQTPPPTEVHR